MKHTHAAQLCGALKNVKLAGIETAEAYKIVTTIVDCNRVVERIQQMVQTTAEGLKDKKDADLQAEVNKVVTPYLEQELKVETLTKETLDKLIEQGMKADEVALIYQFMFKSAGKKA